MPRSGARIGAELVGVMLVLAIVAGSLALVVATHRRYLARPASGPKPVVAIAPPPVPKKARPKPDPAPPTPPEPVDDPTPRELARIGRLIAEERAGAERSDRRAAGLARAVEAARREQTRWDRRTMLVRAQVDELERQANRLEDEADALARERDILARKRDEARSELARARARSDHAVAVLPYKGPNGTWRRPIPIECKDGSVTLQPGGPSFSLLELESALGGIRSNPLVLAVASALVRAQRAETPDGSASVPYILFIIRPDGIRPYYAARGTLEPLGINFGYELVNQEEEIDFPDLDDPDVWRDAPTLAERPKSAWPPGQGDRAGRERGAWPATPPGGDRPGGFAGLPNIEGLPDGTLGAGRSERGLSGLGGLAPEPVDDPGFFGNGGGSPSGDRPTGGDRPMGGDRPTGGVRSPSGRGGSIGRRLLPRALRSGRGNGRRGLGRGSGWAIDEPREVPPEPGGSPFDRDGSGPDPDPNPPARGGLPLPEQPPRLIPIPPPSEFRPGDRFTADPAGNPAQAQAAAPSPAAQPEIGTGAAPHDASGQVERAARIAATPGGKPAGQGSRGVQSLEVPTGLVAINPTDDQADPTPGRSPGVGIGVGSPSNKPVPKSEGNFAEEAGPSLDHRPLRHLDLVVACGPKEVMIYPGGYRLSQLGLDAPDSPLVQRLRALVHAHAVAEPGVEWKPRLQFQIERGGQENYGKAWRQTMLGGLDWPTTLRAAPATSARWLAGEHQ